MQWVRRVMFSRAQASFPSCDFLPAGIARAACGRRQEYVNQGPCLCLQTSEQERAGRGYAATARRALLRLSRQPEVKVLRGGPTPQRFSAARVSPPAGRTAVLRFSPHPASTYRLAPAVVLAVVNYITDDAPRLAAPAVAARVRHAHDATCAWRPANKGGDQAVWC